MNILYINHYAGSISMGMEFRPYYLAKEWMKLGHKVRIIAADYSHLRKNNPKVKKNFEIQVIDGVEYQFIKTGVYSGNGVSRAVTMEQFCQALILKANKLVEEFKPDVVISSSTYPLDSIPAKRIAKKAGAKLIHEVHDMWPSTLYEVGGMSKKHPFVTLMQIGENYAYRNCDELVSLLSDAKPYMVSHGLKSPKFHCIRNGIDEAEWTDQEMLPEEHQKILDGISEDNKFIVGYFGGHALSNNLDFLLDVAAASKENEKLAFVLVGDGFKKEELMERAEKEALSNVVFLPAVAKNQVPALLNCFDVVFITAMKSPLYRFGVCMNKIFDTMMAATPSVVAVDTPTTPIGEADCGITVEADNVAEAKAAIEELAALTKADLEEMGLRGRNEALEKYTYENIAKQFAELFGKK
ncbi:MAG: glycosyltransferase family 4 protein [Clostridiales bacterium]|nr:glycosyltransferase family 4 protein [Candidatus Crickella merdequi]